MAPRKRSGGDAGRSQQQPQVQPRSRSRHSPRSKPEPLSPVSPSLLALPPPLLLDPAELDDAPSKPGRGFRSRSLTRKESGAKGLVLPPSPTLEPLPPPALGTPTPAPASLRGTRDVFRPHVRPGGHILDLAPYEIWEMIVGLLGPADAFVLRGLCSTMRGAFRADLTERAMAGEILVQLRAFAVDAFLAGMEVGGAGVGVEGSGGAEVGARLSVASSGETAMSSSPSLAPHGGWFTARPPASPRFRPSVYGNGSGGTVFSSSSCSTTTFVDPGDPVRLHHHIDAFLIRALGAEPDRHTDDFTEWAGYDPSLTGLAMAERRDEWLRKGGGSRGRSRSRRHVEWEAAMVAMSGEIKALLCRVWAISGKLYPFSKAENGVWKERKRARLVKEKAAAEREKVRGAEKGKRCGTGDQSSREAGGKQEAEDEKTWEKTPRKPRRPNRSGSPDFHRSILADHRTIDYYVANLGGQLVKPMLGEGRLSQATLTEMDGLLVAPVSPSTGFTPFTSASVPDLSTVHIDLAAAGNEASLSSSPAPTTAVLPGSQREVCRACLSLFTEDGGCRVLRFPPSLDAESRKSLHMAAQRLGLRTCSFGDGTKRFMVAVKKGVTIFRD